MAKFSLRRYDIQARVSLIVSLASLFALMGMAGVIFRRFSLEDWTINYGLPTKYAAYASTLATLALSITGFGFGLNSVGQRRNDKQQLSWIGFFVGAGVLTMALILFALFRIRGESVIPTT